MTTPKDTAVLLLRLAGPLQSWGENSKFNRRETRLEPTKSGVVGLLAAALGFERGADLSALTNLSMGVRTDQAGTLLRDFHTISDYYGRPLKQSGVNAKGLQKLTAPAKYTHVTQRYYLQDAVFLVGLAGQTDTVAELAAAVKRPAFPLALGRRSCPPTHPILVDTPATELIAALSTHPWQASEAGRADYLRGATPAFVHLPVTIDDPAGGETRPDVPVSFGLHDRQYRQRRVRHTTVQIPTGFPESDADRADSGAPPAGHDPFSLLNW
ncbi:type I-E CRISPR-associated protein Cas5/CasD [Nocardia sp. NPDC059180]|uniref:type I-E CRISPR-associated protein Cas5/CasD n=1 Tax=Nocardia sp. NPDC059180 TaxID=3346761 RepID=UPI0036883F73